jgi:hypothetical protein
MDNSFCDTTILPDNIFSLSNDEFFVVVQKLAGDSIVEMLKLQYINSTKSLLRTENVFNVFSIACNDSHLLNIKKKVGFQLDDGTFVVKDGVKSNMNYLLKLLEEKQQELILKNTDNNNHKVNQQIPFDLISNNPLLKSLISYYEKLDNTNNRTEESFLQSFINNVTSNLYKSSNRYRYEDQVMRFAMILYIYAGQHSYEFVRLNLGAALPALPSLKKRISDSNVGTVEGEFKYDLLAKHLQATKTKYVLLSEDCTGVIKKIRYNKKTNTFVGFCTPIARGLPVVKNFQTESFEQLQYWFDNVNKAPLLNVHMAQPIVQDLKQSSAFLLSAYGVDSKFTSLDIIRRWFHILEECLKKDIRVIGFATGIFVFSSSKIELIIHFLFLLFSN